MTDEQLNELAQNLMNTLALGDDAVVRKEIVYCFQKVQVETRKEVKEQS